MLHDSSRVSLSLTFSGHISWHGEERPSSVPIQTSVSSPSASTSGKSRTQSLSCFTVITRLLGRSGCGILVGQINISDILSFLLPPGMPFDVRLRIALARLDRQHRPVVQHQRAQRRPHIAVSARLEPLLPHRHDPLPNYVACSHRYLHNSHIPHVRATSTIKQNTIAPAGTLNPSFTIFVGGGVGLGGNLESFIVYRLAWCPTPFGS